MRGEGGCGGGGEGARDMIFVFDSFYTNKPRTSHGKDLQTLCCSGLGNLSVARILVEG